MDSVIAVINSIGSFMDAQSSVIAIVLGILFSVSKMVSNEKAPGIVKVVQSVFDGAAKLLKGSALVFEKLSSFLAELVKSDGILGKK